MDSEHKAGLVEQLEQFEHVARGGWKVGLTSGTSRDSMGVGFRPFGQIRANRIFKSGASIALADVGDIGVENELCFSFGETVPADADRSKLKECVAAILPAFELNERRLASSATSRERLADNLSQYGIVLGDPIFDHASINLSQVEVTLSQDGGEVASVASQGHIDDHYDSLLALVKVLAAFDCKIEWGDFVITGAFGRSRVTQASKWRGDFSEGIGFVEVEFT